MDTIIKKDQTKLIFQNSLGKPKKNMIGIITILLFLSIFLLPSCDCDYVLNGEEEEDTETTYPYTNVDHDDCVLSDQLLACYPFNRNVNDVSRFENHGFAGGAVLTTNRFEEPGSAYLFDGIDDYLEVEDSEELDLMDEFTISVWIYPTTSKSARILGKGRKVNGPSATPYWMAIQNKIIYFYLADDVETVYRAKGNITEINEWSMLSAVFKDQKMYLYVNAELQVVTDIPGRLKNVSNPLVIGSRLSQPSSTFEGKIDDVGIYNYALNDEELRCLMVLNNT